MGHPNPRFLAVAQRATQAAESARSPSREKKGVGTAWKIVAIAAGAGILFWTLSSPKTNDEGDDGELDGGEGARPTRALPPGQESATGGAPTQGQGMGDPAPPSKVEGGG